MLTTVYDKGEQTTAALTTVRVRVRGRVRDC